MTTVNPIEQAQQVPNGARFYRCALQVNPFSYLLTQNKDTPYTDEAAYNAAIVQACLEHGIEVIGITDHYRVRHSVTLKAAADEAGIRVFPGFDYVIERTIPNPPVVRDDRNQQLAVTPLDIVPQVEIYGQHEISDLTKDSEKLTRLLDRFVTQDQDLDTRRSDLRRELARSRRRVLDGHHETVQVQDRLAALPALEETLKRFQDAGLEDRLKEQSLLVREERILKTAEQRLEPFRDILDQLRRALPIDRAFLSQKALEDLPGKAILARSERVLQEFHHEIESLVTRYGEALVNADAGLAEVGTDWDKRKQRVLEAYEQILRDLQKSKIDGAEFMRLRQQIEELQPLRERLAALQRDLREHEEHRRKLLTEWNDLRSEEYRQLERAAKKVNRKLAGTVEVRVTFSGKRERTYDQITRTLLLHLRSRRDTGRRGRRGRTFGGRYRGHRQTRA